MTQETNVPVITGGAEPGKTFAERFCDRHGIARSEYTRTVSRQALYSHARPLVPILSLIWSDYSRSDLDFVGEVGRLFRLKNFESAAFDFQHHDKSWRFFRRTLRIRVSAKKLLRLVKETMG